MFFFLLSLRSLVCIFHLQHICIWASHISNVRVASGYRNGQCSSRTPVPMSANYLNGPPPPILNPLPTPNCKHCQFTALSFHVLVLWLDPPSRFLRHPLPTDQLLSKWLKALLPMQTVQPLTFPPYSSTFLSKAAQLSPGCRCSVLALPCPA